jgi:hypothetical protein
MSTRQSRFLFVNGSVHIDVPIHRVPWDPTDDVSGTSVTQFFSEYLQPLAHFVTEHESRHVQQTLAYPALYLRAIREYRWALSALDDFRSRGDLPYDPRGLSRPATDLTDPIAGELARAYYTSVARYYAGRRADGGFVWGPEEETRELSPRRRFSEVKLLEAEAIAVHYNVSRKRGTTERFHPWARSGGAATSAIDDLVTVLTGNQDRDEVEELVLRFVPALVWHSFHTTWPVTAFWNYLEALIPPRGITQLAGMDSDGMFVVLGTLRFSERMIADCPLVTDQSLEKLIRENHPLADPWQQFDYDARLWAPIVDAEDDYPLRVAAHVRNQDGRWPDNLDFIDPSPEVFLALQAQYPASGYLVRVEAGDVAQGRRGVFRRLIPKSSWHVQDLTQWRERLAFLERAQVILANVYVQTSTLAAHGGRVEQTCWHSSCPVYSTFLCRLWDAIPQRYPDCEFLVHMERVLNHTVDAAGSGQTIRRVDNNNQQ